MSVGRLLVALLLGAVWIGVAAAPALALSPGVATLSAAPVGETTATLNANVNPNGTATKAYFEYGPTTSYGSKTAEVSVGSGGTTVKVNVPISGLTKDTIYHFRIVATNASGTSLGAAQFFETIGPPQIFSGGAEPDPSGESATLYALLDPNDQSTTYQFEYGTASGTYTVTAPVPAESAGPEPEVVSYKITGLTPGTKYYWRPTASNVNGKAYGEELSFLSSKAPRIENLAAEVSSSMTTLKAMIEPHELATKYYFEYGTTPAYGGKTSTLEISGEEETVSVARHLKLNPSTLYHYRLVAENSAGKVISKDQTFTTLAVAALYAGGKILGSAPVKMFSSNLTFENGSCSEAEFTGEVTTNPLAMHNIMGGKMQNAGGAGCPWGSLTVKYSIPIKEAPIVNYGIVSSGEGRVLLSEIELNAKIYIAGSLLGECKVGLSLAGAFKPSSALQLTLSGEMKRLSGYEICPSAESVAGTFSVTSAGTAVEAKPWP